MPVFLTFSFENDLHTHPEQHNSFHFKKLNYDKNSYSPSCSTKKKKTDEIIKLKFCNIGKHIPTTHSCLEFEFNFVSFQTTRTSIYLRGSILKSGNLHVGIDLRRHFIHVTRLLFRQVRLYQFIPKLSITGE